MHPDSGPDENESSHRSGDTPSPLRRDDDVLLQRLKDEPPLKRQAPLSLTLGIVAGVLALGTILYFIFRNPDVYVSTAPSLGSGQQQQHAHADSSQIKAKRMRLAPLIDSLENAARAHDNHETELALANAYYDGEYWDKALAPYDHYLEHEPNNVNARIDFAFAITQVSGDFNLAISEIDKALAIDPDHIQGLFNAGILSLRANINNKEAALASAGKYFGRAKEAAAKQGNTHMSQQIDAILQEMQNVSGDSTSR